MNAKVLHAKGELKKRVKELERLLSPCRLCPRGCGADRLAGETGQCGAGREAAISGYGPHFGEEGPLVGRGGSGTIFFAFCSLRCVFCQNWEISHGEEAQEVTGNELAEIMLELQERGCENINLVTPTHYVPQIVAAVDIACARGLNIPLVYNSSGYERLETLQLLDGVIDIYLPDIKYADEEIARRYSRIADYPRVANAALKEMQRQVGDLLLDARGVAVRGLLIRHPVMPGGIAGTDELMRFIAQEVSPNAWINIMDQYYPAYLAYRYGEIARRITPEEYEAALAAARRASAGFHLL